MTHNMGMVKTGRPHTSKDETEPIPRGMANVNRWKEHPSVTDTWSPSLLSILSKSRDCRTWGGINQMRPKRPNFWRWMEARTDIDLRAIERLFMRTFRSSLRSLTIHSSRRRCDPNILPCIGRVQILRTRREEVSTMDVVKPLRRSPQA